MFLPLNPKKVGRTHLRKEGTNADAWQFSESFQRRGPVQPAGAAAVDTQAYSMVENGVSSAHKVSAARASPIFRRAGTSRFNMSLPDQTPKLPKIPFLVGDVILLGAAWYLAQRDPGPLSVQAIAAITGCVVFAAIIGAIPFLTDYARKQDEALDERQRGLEALSRTINTAAEQISIAANGLNELTDLTHKNLKHAEQLPHKLQDKIAEFNAQLDNARDNDREELEKELVELRTSETERLQSIAEKVHKAIGELTRLDNSVQEKLKRGPSDSSVSSSAHSDGAAEILKAVNTAIAELKSEFVSAQNNALKTLNETFAERTREAIKAIEAAIHANLASSSATHAPASADVNPSDEPAAATEVASPPRRPRKARRDDSAPQAPAPVDPLSSPVVSADAGDGSHSPPPFFEPVPVPAAAIAQIEPVAPDSAEPFSVPSLPITSNPITPVAEVAAASHQGSDTIPAASDGPVERPARKRPNRPASAHLQYELTDEPPATSDDAPVSNAELMERVISSDGATRLIATSYIGIGNRLFIRGDGPGLSWEKGVPLQFISIGKWRWESADAIAPISFKLYKNDEVECPGLGTQVLEPGHQQDVIAKF
jgi:hypothetical protein